MTVPDGKPVEDVEAGYDYVWGFNSARPQSAVPIARKERFECGCVRLTPRRGDPRTFAAGTVVRTIDADTVAEANEWGRS